MQFASTSSRFSILNCSGFQNPIQNYLVEFHRVPGSRFCRRTLASVNAPRRRKNETLDFAQDTEAVLKVRSGSAADVPVSERDEFNEPFRRLKFMEKKADGTQLRGQILDKSKLEVRPPRWTRMPIDQDWPSVWPTASTFKASAVPLPVRMGWQRFPRFDPPPKKYANLELMKIPNFLHLTPKAIERHCRAIKRFCTPWPEELKTDEDCDVNFPISVINSDFVHAGPSIRDRRSRVVTIKIKLSVLNLDDHARDKFLRLIGEKRYDLETDMVTITADRCPSRQQNKDYAKYLLTVLNSESWKKEDWENEKVEVDEVRFVWRGTECETRTINMIRQLKVSSENYTKAAEETRAEEAVPSEGSDSTKDDIDPDSGVEMVQNEKLPVFPSYLSKLSSNPTDEEILALPEVQNHIEAWETYRNEVETEHSTRMYTESVKALFGPF